MLIAEDEFLIAMQLEAMFDDAGAEVLGPVTSVSNALDIVMSSPKSVIRTRAKHEPTFC